MDNKDLKELDVLGFLEGQDYFSDLSEGDKTELVKLASQVYENKAFQKIIRFFINQFASQAILQTEDMDKVSFHRAGIDALYLVLKEFEKLNLVYKDEFKNEPYDKNEII